MTAEAVILGSGTSHGVPSLGVQYSPEFLANPKNHRMRPACLLRGPGGNVLIDCGPEIRLQLLREQVMSLEAVILTHHHADHVMGMDDLRAFTQRSGLPMPIYANPLTQEQVRRIFPYAFRSPDREVEVPRFELHDLPDRLHLAGLPIEIFWVLHGDLPVAGVRVGSFGYITDVSEIPPEASRQLEGVETLVVDAVRRKPHPTHFHLERAVEEVRRLGIPRAFFTHLSGVYDHEATNAELPPGMALAFDGLRLSLNF